MQVKEKILIAGASGTIGIPLTRSLVTRGYTVIGLTRTPGKQKLLEQAGAAAVIADVLDAPALERAIRGAAPDWVVDLLTALPKNGPTVYSHLAPTNRLRAQGTANLLHASIAAGAKRIVGESMIFVYGFGDHGDTPLVESDPLQPREANPHLQAIVAALRSLEEQFLAANARGSIEAIPLRYGLFYGPDNPSTLYMLGMVRKRLFPAFRDTRGVSGWIQTGDAVSATIAALECGRPGEIYNIVDDDPVNLNELVRYAAGLLGASPPFTVPFWLLRRILPFFAAFSTTRLPVSNQKARVDLDWHPRYPGCKDGLRELLKP
jgi:nucleoside-diphosphate-sugar epimerase